MKIQKPEFFNGDTFMRECANASIKLQSFYDDGEGNLIIDVDNKSESKIASVLAIHDGSNTPLTTLEKLQMAGVNFDELRAALGL
jgi:hypothetical protein